MKEKIIDAHYIEGNSKDHADYFVLIAENLSQASILTAQSDEATLGVVMSAELTKPSIRPILEEIKGHSKIKVIRHEFPELDHRFENGLSIIYKDNFAAEVTIKKEDLGKLESILEKHSDYSLILALDFIDRKDPVLKVLSKHPGLCLKIICSNIDFEQSRPWILDAIDIFGSDNVMFGGGDKQAFEAILAMIDDFSSQDKENLFSGSVSKWYKLDA
tara:strand:- start:110 stop:760 length:651 start_codon:yes stop_codon:yes gene_type:complete